VQLILQCPFCMILIGPINRFSYSPFICVKAKMNLQLFACRAVRCRSVRGDITSIKCPMIPLQ